MTHKFNPQSSRPFLVQHQMPNDLNQEELILRNIYDAIEWLYGDESCSHLNLENYDTDCLDDYFRGALSSWVLAYRSTHSNQDQDPLDTATEPFARFEPSPTDAEREQDQIDYSRIAQGTGTSILIEPYIDSGQAVRLEFPILVRTLETALQNIALAHR